MTEKIHYHSPAVLLEKLDDGHEIGRASVEEHPPAPHSTILIVDPEQRTDELGLALASDQKVLLDRPRSNPRAPWSQQQLGHEVLPSCTSK
ncbi:hypothetical protein TKK_0004796 [Trichogramma kaykai]